jgi:long-subunit fatty acid transport protein
VRYRPKVAFIALVALLLGGSPAGAQASLQVPLEFDFLNPGARSLALGSAFVGLADDATAAFTNPAGLTILSLSEVAFELRGRRIETRYLQQGRLSGTLTNQGIDTVNGPQYGIAESQRVGPGFFSFVYPRKNKLALAGYRHQFTTVDANFATQGVFQLNPTVGDIRETALQATQSLQITNYGASFAFRPKTTFSIGAGFSTYTFDFDATYTRFVTFPQYQPATYEPNRATFEGRLTGDDVAFGGNAGVLWMPTGSFQAGAVYRRAPSFAFQQSLRDLPSGSPSVTTGTFQVPDVFAAGAALRPTESTLLTVEYTFVDYRALKDDYIDVQARPSGRESQFSIDSGSEVHLGFEYVFVSRRLTPALRVGYWRDPAHSVTYAPHDPPDNNSDERFAAYLPPGAGLSHYTFGGGIPATRNFEINGAADLSSRRKFYSISLVARF